MKWFHCVTNHCSSSLAGRWRGQGRKKEGPAAIKNRKLAVTGRQQLATDSQQLQEVSRRRRKWAAKESWVYTAGPVVANSANTNNYITKGNSV